jgi:hypothetical protein
MNIEKIAYQTGVDAPSANLKLFADLIIKNYHDENYQVRTDNTQLIANMEAKIAEISNDWIVRGYKLIDTEAKLAIAVEALEIFDSTLGAGNVAREALNKIKGE